MKKILIISTCSQKLSELEFVNPIIEILKHNNTKFKQIHYSRLTQNELDSTNKIIICGTALQDNDYQKNVQQFNWIPNSKIPILGICSGAQILANAFSGKIIQGNECGIYEGHIKYQDVILDNVDITKLYCIHNFTCTLPKLSQVLVETQFPQIFKIQNHYGCFFHPEVKQKELIINFIKNN
jgi:GMP synthase-like glutamine amidotransferase